METLAATSVNNLSFNIIFPTYLTIPHSQPHHFVSLDIRPYAIPSGPSRGVEGQLPGIPRQFTEERTAGWVVVPVGAAVPGRLAR